MQKLPRMQVPPFLQQLRLCSAPAGSKGEDKPHPVREAQSPPLGHSKFPSTSQSLIV